MGMQSKSKRNENDPVMVRIDDMDFVFSFDNIDKQVKLNEKSSLLLHKAIDGDRRLLKNKKRIMAGDYEVLLNSSEDVNNLWLSAFDKLAEYKFIEKDGKDYIVTSKGLKYFESL